MQISRWKQVLIDRAVELFETSKPVDIEKITDPLYKEIGRLKMDVEWLKKNGEELSSAERLRFIDPTDPAMSIRHQCELSNISRSWYYKSLEPCMEVGG